MVTSAYTSTSISPHVKHYLISNTTNQSTIDQPEICHSIQEALPDIMDELYLQIIFGFFYTLIWLFGVGGNGMVLYMVLWKRLDFSVRTVFIVSLSFSDLLMAFSSLPVTALSTFTRGMIPGFLCYSIGLLQASSVFVSSFTLIIIAIDRYYLICYPHSVKITYHRAKWAVGFFWAVGLTLAIPMMLFMKVESAEPYGICGEFCMEKWPEPFWDPYGKRIYGVVVFSIQYGLPMFLCSIFYVEISLQIGFQFERRQKTQVITAEVAERSMQRRRRTNLMMVSMVMTFVISWLPLNVANLVRDFDLFNSVVSVYYFTLTFAISHLLAMTSILWNPIIYSFFNQNFRAAIKQMLARRRPGSGSSSGRSSTMATWL